MYIYIIYIYIYIYIYTAIEYIHNCIIQLYIIIISEEIKVCYRQLGI